HSVWTTDHLLVPKQHADVFGFVIEALLSLAHVAAITQRVRLGTSIIVLSQRNAVLFAKQVAALDQLSNGRVILGVGAGWMEGEFKYLNVNFRQRGRILDESIAVCRAMWEQDEPAFHGRFYNFDGAVSNPKPIQSRIPIWIGGNSDAAIQRGARNDGWHSNSHNPEWLAPKYAEVKRLSDNRATTSTRFSVDLDPNKPPLITTSSGETRRRLTGTPDTVRDTLREYRQVGLEYPVLFFPQLDLAAMLKQMETFAREVIPAMSNEQ
ncbi:MAG: TIGR03619 family F420-dependent LLM class oxidoreductase, partial [Chloroflexi bacterium]|nr:TIGR03619 family F420-dependent LLM class oxidoreductase [Chloroflexota bacterium]